MYAIIVGCGSLGSELAIDLSLQGHDVVVIDKEVEALRRLGSGFNGMVISGIGIDEDILINAGIENADIFVALTNDDSINIVAAQVAKNIFSVETVIARLYNPEKEHIYKELGISTIHPDSLTIKQIKKSIFNGKLNKLVSIESGDSEIVSIPVSKKISGIMVKEVQIPNKFKIFGIIQDAETIMPGSDYILNVGDTILALVRLDAIETVIDLIIDMERDSNENNNSWFR